MATRYSHTAPTLSGMTVNVYIDDTSYVGSATDFEIVEDGLIITNDGPQREKGGGVTGSSCEVGVLVPDSNSGLETLISDINGAEEGRFTLKVTRGAGVGEQLYWCGYILPDVSIREDLDTYQFTIRANDGIARLKKIEYADTTGTPAPYGSISFVEHIINALTTEDDLATLYYTASDEFLRTVVNWYESGHGASATNKCPLEYSRVTGEAFAERNSAGEWTFDSCFDVLDKIAKAWNARIYYSGGSYRFDQINARAESTITERRFNSSASLISSDNTVSYLKALTQNAAGARTAVGTFPFLSAVKEARIKYDHDTLRNYLEYYGWWWSFGSITNSELTFDNVEVDSDTYIRISGTIYADVSLTGSYSVPWFQQWGIRLRIGNYYLHSRVDALVQGNGNPADVLQRETPEWDDSELDYYYITTDLLYSDSFKGEIPFSFYTPAVPTTSENEVKIHIVALGALDHENNNEVATFQTWGAQNLVMTILSDNEDSPNYETKRTYVATNSTAGNSEVVEYEVNFGHAVKKWSPRKVQVSSDKATWVDATATWDVDGEAENVEFGQLLARQIVAGRAAPTEIYSGTVIGDLLHAHSLMQFDSKKYILISGSKRMFSEEFDGEWAFSEYDDTAPTDGNQIPGNDIPAEVQRFKPSGVFNPYSGKVAISDPVSAITLSAITANTLSADVAAGAVTTLSLNYPVKGGIYLAGDEIFLIDPSNSKINPVTIAAEAAEGATTLNVTGTTLTESFKAHSKVVYSTLNKTTDQGGDGVGGIKPGTATGQILRWDGDSWEPYSGTTNDYVLTWDPTNGWQAEENTGGGTTYTFTNGLNEASGTVKLGGALTEDTLISGSSFDLNYTMAKFIRGTTSTGWTAPTTFANGGTGNTLTSSALHLSGNGGDNNAKLTLGVGDNYGAGVGYFFTGAIMRMYHMNTLYSIRFALGSETADKVVITSDNIGRMGVGFSSTTGMHSTLQTGGSFGTAVTTFTGNYTPTEDDHTMIKTGSGSAQIIMPAANTCEGREYIIMNHGSVSITMTVNVKSGSGVQFGVIDSSQFAYMKSDGTDWRGYRITTE